MFFVADCLWNTWAYWADCNTTCGGGWQIRHRSKEGPQHNGADCVGSPEDSQRCNTFPCPSKHRSVLHGSK